MASNLKVDIVKPTATNGSLSLKGDSGGSATTNGISVDSSGDTSITGTTTIATADINGGAIDGTTIGASSAAAGSFTSVDATSASLDGAVTINDSGADVDFRVESDTVDHALFVQGSDGYVGIGVSSPADKLHVDGNIRLVSPYGINFSAYATSGNPSSNLLDDYEEGTWTATFTGSSDTETGYYTKVGRLVNAIVYSGAISVGSSVDARIGGLPFEVSQEYAAGSITFNTYATNAENGHTVPGTTYFTLVNNNSTTTAQTVSGNPKYIMMSVSYIAA